MFKILKKVFGKTTDAIKDIAPKKKKFITKDEFEDILLEADVNYDLAERLLDELSGSINKVQAFNSLISVFQYKANWKESDAKPFVEMIVGVNGAGKSTLVAILNNILQKDSGKIEFFGKDFFNRKTFLSRAIIITELFDIETLCHKKN